MHAMTDRSKYQWDMPQEMRNKHPEESPLRHLSDR